MAGPTGEAAAQGERFFRADLKCCTYHPFMPNFAVGALLADTTEELAPGRQRMRSRLAMAHGVGPQGVEMHGSYRRLSEGAGGGMFGLEPGLLCPYYDASGQRCSIWSLREAACSTYHCKFRRGQDGARFWEALRDYLLELRDALVAHVLLELDWAPDRVVRRSAIRFEDDADESTAHRQRLWGEWYGREQQLYLRCHDIVRGLGPGDAEVLGGVRLRARARVLERAQHRAFDAELPARLQRNPELRVREDGASGYVVEGYSADDPSRVGAPLLRALDVFDGQRDHASARQVLRSEGHPAPNRKLLRLLYHHRLLVEPPST